MIAVCCQDVEPDTEEQGIDGYNIRIKNKMEKSNYDPGEMRCSRLGCPEETITNKILRENHAVQNKEHLGDIDLTQLINEALLIQEKEIIKRVIELISLRSCIICGEYLDSNLKRKDWHIPLCRKHRMEELDRITKEALKNNYGVKG